MLSLGSNISATQAVEAKYSASLDGTDDFIDCGLIDFNTSDFSVSCWIKVREWTQYSAIWGNRSSSDNQNIGVTLRTTGVTGELQLFSDWGTPTDSSIVTGVPADTWVHVVCTGDRDGNQVIYLNHDDATTTTDISDRSSVDFTSDLEFRIARTHTNHYHNMSISQLGIWNVALSANAVEALYNNGKPINLRINQGNYTNSSDLQQYYKFGDGSFDEKAQGSVHDQGNPGFGSNLVANADFSANQAETQTYLNGGLEFNDWIEQQSSGLRKYELTSDGQGIRCTIETQADDTWHNRIYQDISSSLTAGDIYEYEIDVLCSQSCNFRVGIQQTNSSNDNTAENVTVVANQRTVFKEVFKCVHDGSGTAQVMHIFPLVTLAAGEYYEVRSPRLRKLNGNPGLTSGGVTFSSDAP